MCNLGLSCLWPTTVCRTEQHPFNVQYFFCNWGTNSKVLPSECTLDCTLCNSIIRDHNPWKNHQCAIEASCRPASSMCIQHFNSIIGGAQSMKESPGSRVLHQIFPGCHIRINMVRPSVKLRRGFARSFHGGWFLASLGLLFLLSTNQFCLNFWHTLIIWYHCFVCAKLFASHYSGVCWFNPLVSTSSSTTTTCFTFVPGVLYFCARGALLLCWGTGLRIW